MIIRVISFFAGAIFGGLGALAIFHVVEHSSAEWRIVGLAAVVMGLLAAAFGKKFWDVALTIWP